MQGTSCLKKKTFICTLNTLECVEWAKFKPNFKEGVRKPFLKKIDQKKSPKSDFTEKKESAKSCYKVLTHKALSINVKLCIVYRTYVNNNINIKLWLNYNQDYCEIRRYWKKKKINIFWPVRAEKATAP